MSHVFILIYSGGGGMKSMEHLKGVRAIKVWDPPQYTIYEKVNINRRPCYLK
jgi:hypothetical protein